MLTMQSRWEEFCKIAVPPSYTEPMLKELKKVFYAGAYAAFNLQVLIDSQPIVIEAKDMLINDLVEEVNSFIQKLNSESKLEHYETRH